MSRALILTTADDPSNVHSPFTPDLVVALLWASPETLDALRIRYRAPVVSGGDIFRDMPALEQEAFALAHALCETLPRYRDVHPLLGYEPRIAGMILPHVAIKRLLTDLETRLAPGSVLVFPHGAPWADSAAGSEFRVEHLSPETESDTTIVGRGARFIADVAADRDVRRLFQDPVERLGPRFRPPRAARFPRGGAWAYSSYINFSRALARYEAARADAFHWIINTNSGRRGLPQHVQPFHLWDFHGVRGRKEHRGEVFQVIRRLGEGLRDAGLPRSMIQDVVTLMSRVVPDVIREIDLQYSFVDRAKPDEIWVGNQWGSELTLTQVARSRAIPVTQIQHGVLEANYRWSPVYTDRFFVWGEGWRDGISASERSRVSVLDPDTGGPDGGGVKVGPPARRLTFFTAPASPPLWANSVVIQESGRLIRELASRGWRVTVRVHPLESTRAWQNVVGKLGHDLSTNVRVDARTNMSQLLAQTDVALMFRSTVFLSCAAMGIPSIALGWYPFTWDELLERTDVIQLARSIRDAVLLCEKRYEMAQTWSPELSLLLDSKRRGES